ncbi:hypothetical protein RCO28_12215 [Streptomyces sp. LHD-70]|uniref:hypothetical protein n=1 Tax=Streptomyces sp. LHD-70 TaxID=3072140 RepID=UPI00280D9170|nr:hypothetical protein [Streptomyces sp. LHD-70]MDQ8703247.1 hypothetical protein [Streptomyces sp. LHD-70]
MNDTFNSRLDSEHITAHTGGGTQHVHNYFGPSRRFREQNVQPLAEDHLRWLYQRFAPPDGLDNARRVLDRTRTVLLQGSPGVGRNAAARMLLFEYNALRPTLREVLPEDDRGELLLDSRQIDQGEGLLLDLSTLPAEKWPRIREALSGYHATIQQKGCRLAVVLPHQTDLGIHGALAMHLAELRRPDPEAALRRALRKDDLPEDLPSPPPQPVLDFLRGAPPMRRVGALALQIVAAWRAEPHGKMDGWCSTAVTPFLRRPEQVAEDLGRLVDGRDRALLLSTAMLEGSRSDAVYEACESLLATVEFPPDKRPLLEREDLSERFRRIRATPDKQGRVSLSDSGAALAVRTHFWNNMPGLRGQLGTWVGETLTLRTLSEDDRCDLAGRFAEQTLGTGRPDELLVQVRSWVERKGAPVWPAAAQALTYGALHPEMGRDFRKVLYDWATTATLAPGLSRVLLEVCKGPFAQRYPEQALVRLHHLARQRRSGHEAESELVERSLSTHHLHRFMLDRLADGLTNGRHCADTPLFLALSTPEALTGLRDRTRPLLDERTVRENLTTCWEVLFDRVPAPQWSDHAHVWLSTADASSSGRSSQYVEVLVNACRGRPKPCGQLYHLARGHAVADAVLRRINAAQGVPSD